MKTKILLLAACLGACKLSAAQTCPETLVVKAEAAAPEPGWQVKSESRPLQLTGVTIFGSPPGSSSSGFDQILAPIGHKNVAYWNFTAPGNGEAWMSCHYESMVTISKPIDTDVVLCIHQTEKRTAKSSERKITVQCMNAAAASRRPPM